MKSIPLIIILFACTNSYSQLSPEDEYTLFVNHNKRDSLKDFIVTLKHLDESVQLSRNLLNDTIYIHAQGDKYLALFLDGDSIREYWTNGIYKGPLGAKILDIEYLNNDVYRINLSSNSFSHSTYISQLTFDKNLHIISAIYYNGYDESELKILNSTSLKKRLNVVEPTKIKGN